MDVNLRFLPIFAIILHKFVLKTHFISIPNISIFLLIYRPYMNLCLQALKIFITLKICYFRRYHLYLLSFT